MSLDSHFDAIVVGSGFGGSVTAYRLAEAGKRVCVLERGRPYPPGSFTRSPYRARESFWDPPRGLTGMYHYWSFKGIDALVSAGLGGGSLIYANVFMRKDESWFVQEDLNDGGYEYWPVTREDLDPHYDRVEQMIGLQRYPFEHEPYVATPKTIAFKEAAEANGLEWFLPQLAVTFANEGRPPVPGEAIVEELPNLHGRTRTTCQLCGECDVGCNYGAKNTLDYNYLTHAKHHGAEIRTLADVRRIEPREGGGYRSTTPTWRRARPGGNGRPSPLRAHLRPPDPQRRHARHHEPAAAQPQRVPALSAQARHALLRQRRPADAGAQHAEVTDGKRIAADRRPRLRPGDHHDGADARRARRRRGPRLLPAGRGLPAAPGLDPARARRAASSSGAGATAATYLVKNWLKGSPDTDVTGHIADLLRAGRAVRRRPAAARHGPRRARRAHVPAQRPPRHRLEDATSSSEYFDRLRSTSRDFAHALGGRFADNPLWFLKRVITVHPLGGAPMGRHRGRGRRRRRTATCSAIPGLHIADGSVMPGPDGPEPQLHDRGAGRPLRRPDHRSRPTRRGGGRLMTASVRFTEEMLGHVTFGEPTSPAAPSRTATAPGRSSSTSRSRSTTSSASATTRCAPRRRASAGLECDALGGKLPVEQGWFNLFVDVEPGVKHMLYRLWFRDGVGHPVTMTGFKLVKDDAGFDVWKDTTTLFTRVLHGHVPRATTRTAPSWSPPASSHPRARLRQAAHDVPRRAGSAPTGALVKFGAIFLGQLAEAYLRKGRRPHVHAQG